MIFGNCMREVSLTKLTIKKAEFYGFHGVREEEQVLGGKFQVDAELYYDSKAAIVNDDVNFALNYEEAMNCIQEIISDESYNLMETIANEILNSFMDKFPNLQKATVRVRKFNAPVRNIIDFIEAEQTMFNKV